MEIPSPFSFTVNQAEMLASIPVISGGREWMVKRWEERRGEEVEVEEAEEAVDCVCLGDGWMEPSLGLSQSACGTNHNAACVRRLYGLFSLRWEMVGGGGRELECCDQAVREKRWGQGRERQWWGGGFALGEWSMALINMQVIPFASSEDSIFKPDVHCQSSYI